MKTIGSSELEAEYIASKLLYGMIIPAEYSRLRILISEIPEIDLSNFSLDIERLKKEVITNLGLVDDFEVEQFFYGKNVVLYKLLSQIKNKASNMLPTLIQASNEEAANQAMKTQAALANSPDVLDMVQYLNLQSEKSAELQAIEDIVISAELAIQKIEAILELYGMVNVKLTKKHNEINDLNEFKLFIDELSNSVPESGQDPIIVVKLVSAIDAINKFIPSDELNPFAIELLKNEYEQLCHPKDFYKNCKLDQILTPDIAKGVYSSYPEFYYKFISMLLEGYDKLTYQEQISFKKCFGLEMDDSELISLCSSYIKLGYMS